MRYTVIWTPRAEQYLAERWLNAADRGAVTAAAAIIDQMLGRDPANCGQSRFDTVRFLTIHPIGVDFEVIEDDRLVYVLNVWDAEQDEPSE